MTASTSRSSDSTRPGADPKSGSGTIPNTAVPKQQNLQAAELSRWGGIAALLGVACMIGTVAVVVGLGLPDASDPETLTDFADIETGRIAEHFLYLGALVLFALHAFVLNRLLRPAHPAAALFGTALSAFGLVIMAASSVLHVSTAPLAELYADPSAPAGDRLMIEYAWHGAQSIFDTMLATGLLLVPVGIMFFGLAMLRSAIFGRGLAIVSVLLGTLGFAGAAIEVVDTSTDFSALGVLALVVFNVAVGWRTFRLGAQDHINLADARVGTP